MTVSEARRERLEAPAREVASLLRDAGFTIECLGRHVKLEVHGSSLHLMLEVEGHHVKALVTRSETESGALEYVVRVGRDEAKLLLRVEECEEYECCAETLVEGRGKALRVAEFIAEKVFACLRERFPPLPLKLRFSWVGAVEKIVGSSAALCEPVSTTRLKLKDLSLEDLVLLLTALARSPDDVLVVVAESSDLLSFFGFKPSEGVVYDAKTVVRDSERALCFKGLEALKALLNYESPVLLTVCRSSERAWGVLLGSRKRSEKGGGEPRGVAERGSAEGGKALEEAGVGGAAKVSQTSSEQRKGVRS